MSRCFGGGNPDRCHGPDTFTPSQIILGIAMADSTQQLVGNFVIVDLNHCSMELLFFSCNSAMSFIYWEYCINTYNIMYVFIQ